MPGRPPDHADGAVLLKFGSLRLKLAEVVWVVPSPIQAPLQPVKLFECIGKGCRDVGPPSRSRAPRSPIGWVRTSGSTGSGRRASVRRTPLGRRGDELANAAEAAAVADAIG
jgi:hypothetical protein